MVLSKKFTTPDDMDRNPFVNYPTGSTGQRRGRLKIVTQPTVEPVTLADMLDFMRIDPQNAEQAIVTTQIKAARMLCEQYTRRALLTQTFDYYLDQQPAGNWQELPRPELQSVTAVNYFNLDNSMGVMDPALYFVDTIGEPGRVILNVGQIWPTALRSANALQFRFVAGYGATADKVPDSLIQGIKILVATVFEQRALTESTRLETTYEDKIPVNVKAMWDPYQVPML